MVRCLSKRRGRERQLLVIKAEAVAPAQPVGVVVQQLADSRAHRGWASASTPIRKAEWSDLSSGCAHA